MDDPIPSSTCTTASSPIIGTAVGSESPGALLDGAGSSHIARRGYCWRRRRRWAWFGVLALRLELLRRSRSRSHQIVGDLLAHGVGEGGVLRPRARALLRKGQGPAEVLHGVGTVDLAIGEVVAHDITWCSGSRCRQSEHHRKHGEERGYTMWCHAVDVTAARHSGASSVTEFSSARLVGAQSIPWAVLTVVTS